MIAGKRERGFTYRLNMLFVHLLEFLQRSESIEQRMVRFCFILVAFPVFLFQLPDID